MVSHTLTNFEIDDSNEQILVRDSTIQNEIHRYTYDGQLVETQKVPLAFWDMALIDKNEIALYRSFSQLKKEGDFLSTTDFNFHNLLLYKNSKLIQGYLPYDTTITVQSDVLNTKKNFYRSNGTTLFCQPYDYKIYEIKQDGIRPIYEFVFPNKYSLPVDFNSDKSYCGKKISYLKQKPDKIFTLSDMYKVGHQLYFTFFSYNLSSIIFAYDLNSHSLTPLFKLPSNKNVNFLPLGRSLHAADATSIYTSLPSAEFVKYSWQMKKMQENQLPLNVRQLLKSISNRDNPIIIQLYPKQK
ncbi:hypothetical protein GCM10023149_31230 [Mucilaginibacter gynuensis]|uniref:6-bladed beta-propeller protein n=1 Tax=Mucilaginibacter gynuensis TaxID=1302236 RepID=A0ABP8GNN8_9SPHI